MKKIYTSYLVCALLLISGSSFAYTTEQSIQSAQFLAELGFIKKRDKDSEYNVNSYMTRAEFVAVALKGAGNTIPESYTCKKYYTDVTQNDWICAAVEKAADLGLASRQNKQFHPQNTLTRPEALTLILKASGLDKKIPENLSTYFPKDMALVPNGGTIDAWLKRGGYDPSALHIPIILIDPFDWRFVTCQRALYAGIIDRFFVNKEPGHHANNYQKYKSYYDNGRIYSFREDFFIFRGHAFVIFEAAYKKMQLVSGEVSI